MQHAQANTVSLLLLPSESKQAQSAAHTHIKAHSTDTHTTCTPTGFCSDSGHCLGFATLLATLVPCIMATVGSRS